MNYLNLDDDQLKPVATELNGLLADYHVYYQNIRNFHWNVTGRSFFFLHEKFEEMYNDAQLKIDEIAERLLSLRFHPMSKMSEYLKISEVQESSLKQTDREMVEALLGNHKILLKRMTDVIKKAEEAQDEGTVDLIGAYIRELEKVSWMLSAWHKETEAHYREDVLGKNS